MKKYFLAVDIGASSGRHMLASYEEGKISLEEVYRFPNGACAAGDGTLCWNHEELFSHLVRGIARCGEIGKKPSYMAIDTWGVDFVLLDAKGTLIGNAVSYRDNRTEGMEDEVYKIISEEALYRRTGIQKQIYNTIYQLMAVKKRNPEHLEEAHSFLMMPDYLNFLLTGVCRNEYTNATTTQLVNSKTGEFDRELIEMLGFPSRLFGKLHMPGEKVGRLRDSIKSRVGFDLEVLHAPSHDTASAVTAIPTNSETAAYLSSGTWSLLGTETMFPVISPQSMAANFTNEGGILRRNRFIKNIMGLWIIQSIRKETGNKYCFAEICGMAESCGETGLRIDVNDDAFLSPTDMRAAILAHLKLEDMELSSMLSCVYSSLADYYVTAVRDIVKITGKEISALHIIGGGSKDTYLSKLTAAALDIPVFTGPTEATAIGNILSQMMSVGIFGSLAEAREAVFASFDVNKVEV